MDIKKRLLLYKHAFAAEAAELKITTLMMDGNAGMPARWIAMTHGELAAPGAPVANAWRRSGSL
jgi:hypothetical protein